MVDFTNRISDQGIINQTNVTRVVQDNSVGDLFKNIGSAVTKYNANANVAKEAAISDDILNEIDAFTGTVGEDLPEGLRSGLGRTERMFKAGSKNPGSPKGSNFHARGVTLIKDLRARYPGHGEAIDKAAHRALGYNPRAAYVKEVLANQDAAAAAEKAFYQDEFTMGMLGAQNPSTLDDKTKQEHQVMVQEAKADFAKVAMLEKKGALQKNELREVGSVILRGVMTRLNNDPVVLEWRQSGMPPATPEGQAQLQAAINQARSKLQAELGIFMTKAGPGVSTDDLKKMIDNFTLPLANMAEAIGNKDYNAANFVAQINSYTADLAQAKIIKQFPSSADYQARVKMFGPDAAAAQMDAWSKKFKGYAQYGAYVADSMWTDQGNSTATYADKLEETFKVADMDGKQKNETVRGSMQRFTDVLLSSDSEEALQRALKGMYTDEAIKKTMAMISSGDNDALRFLSQKKITDHINKVGGAPALEQYTQSIMAGFLSNENFQNSVNTIRNMGREVFVTQDGRLYTKSTGNAPAAFRSGIQAFGGRSDPTERINKELAGYNAVLGNMNYAAKKAGTETMGTLIAGELSIHGIQVEVDDEGAKDTKGVSPKSPEAAAPDLDKVKYSEAVLQPIEEAIAEVTGFAEGTGQDYDTLLGYQHKEGSQFEGTKVSEMTIDQAIEFSRAGGDYAKYSKEAVGRMATPMGRYQIVGTTLKGLKKDMGLKGSEKMSPEMQDRMFSTLLKQAGFNQFTSGKIGTLELLDKLDEVWEGLKLNKTAWRKFIQSLAAFEDQEDDNGKPKL